MLHGRLELLVAFWKAWGIQSVVLLSFALQVTLLVMADVRRHKESRKLKAVLWSAYVLADTTAVYALGHMSVTSRSPEHELMALWAPLLLVHLGGQDNITAYAIEDNQLWLRHLQVLGVQVLAAAYVLYESSILRRRTLLRPATILMFVVGVLKYGERVWALLCASNCASSSLSARSYKPPEASTRRKKPATSTWSSEVASTSQGDTDESLLFKAYKMLDVPKQMFEGPTRYVKIHDPYRCDEDEISQVVGMQLSMMYDLLYTKAAVVHTWHGWCVRVISQLSTVAALLLFHSCTLHRHYSRVDVTATYVLLGGAVVLETMSMVRAVFSTWTCVLLLERGWPRLAGVLHFLPRCIRSAVHARYWSGSMGQHDLSGLRTRSRSNLSSKIARWMGREDLWDSTFYSWSTSVPQYIIDRVVELVSKSEGVDKDSADHITNSRGQGALKTEGLIRWTVVDPELDESILIWHIATHLYLDKVNPREYDIAKATRALSCYMVFLLAVRPHMLPYPVSRQRYVQLCYALIISGKDLLHLHLRRVKAALYQSPLQIAGNTTLDRGCKLADYLIERGPEAMTIICDVWVEMLCYTAYRCNENSHAKHLSNGGEIMTAVALLMLYMSNGLIKTRAKGLQTDVLLT